MNFREMVDTDGDKMDWIRPGVDGVRSVFLDGYLIVPRTSDMKVAVMLIDCATADVGPDSLTFHYNQQGWAIFTSKEVPEICNEQGPNVPVLIQIIQAYAAMARKSLAEQAQVLREQADGVPSRLLN